MISESVVTVYWILPWADSKQPVSWWQTENDVKIGLDSSDEKLHRIRQKVGEFLLDGWHQSLSKIEIKLVSKLWHLDKAGGAWGKALITCDRIGSPGHREWFALHVCCSLRARYTLTLHARLALHSLWDRSYGLLTYDRLYSEHVAVMFIRFRVLGDVREHFSVLWVLSDVWYIPHVVIAHHNLQKSAIYQLGVLFVWDNMVAMNLTRSLLPPSLSPSSLLLVGVQRCAQHSSILYLY